MLVDLTTETEIINRKGKLADLPESLLLSGGRPGYILKP